MGAPSQAPVPRHFHGQHLRMRNLAKSSDSPAAMEPRFMLVDGASERELRTYLVAWALDGYKLRKSAHGLAEPDLALQARVSEQLG